MRMIPNHEWGDFDPTECQSSQGMSGHFHSSQLDLALSDWAYLRLMCMWSGRKISWGLNARKTADLDGIYAEGSISRVRRDIGNFRGASSPSKVDREP